jgi:hypothetical protein
MWSLKVCGAGEYLLLHGGELLRDGPEAGLGLLQFRSADPQLLLCSGHLHHEEERDTVQNASGL